MSARVDGRDGSEAAAVSTAAGRHARAELLADHAMGLELQIVELVEQEERAKVQRRWDDAAAIDRQLAPLRAELSATAEEIARLSA